MLRPVAFAALLLSGAASAQTFSAERVHADVAFLADDLLEGRATGSRGYDIAAHYVASRFDALGLKPGGKNGWYQQVPFVTASADPAKPSSLTINGTRFANNEHIIIGPTVAAAVIDQAAPLVFVGYGLENESLGLDDYGGLDVRGKIVVYLWGTPEGLPSEIAATLNDKKSELAVSKGAVGAISIASQSLLQIFPWDRIVKNSALPRMRWVHPDGHVEDPTAALRLSALIDSTAAEALFKGSPFEKNLAAVLADRKARPKGFALPAQVRVERYSVIDKVQGANVLGLLEGTDPQLKNEVVMLSAHLDHLGIMPVDQADRIANGAMDNAAGVATMLEAARAFVDSGQRPKRSILFVALTGEEKGLYGSEYLAKYPEPAGKKLVADVNLDEPLLTYDFSDVIAFGAEHSTIGATVGRAASRMGLKLSPDPAPDQNSFVRSDHYSFVKEGTPAVILSTGYANGGEAAWKEYEDKHYHDPSDDLSQPINWEAGAKFARINYLIARDLADAPQAPRWYSGDFFGEKFAPNAAKAPKP
ncbi:M28 family metallopeptidase [Sphingomonas sp. RB56-2]|uniref:M28 family metallopeptidase n=1 Tax=Sphingomonas brevis TaxID=2908206 RepID=A0ABT0SA82_9SPHN|nr:M28 family metallopeptidase [Sphingomonas brevis]MCL6741253.1 M28 family metallopeptidase [Sphingomonas brevis]